jgi:D-glucosaminate-6-phosphate ammonia-lyase
VASSSDWQPGAKRLADTICRSLKVGKEEIVGMLAAVEMWMKRDHAAEEKLWTSWLQLIADKLRPIPGITTTVRPARGVDNRTPDLNIQSDRGRIDLSEDDLEQILWEGDPRIAIGGKAVFCPSRPTKATKQRCTHTCSRPGRQRLWRTVCAAPS